MNATYYRYFVKELDPTQNSFKLGLKWGVYLNTEITPVAMGFFYDEPVAVAICKVMNEGGWRFNKESESGE